MPTEQKLNTEKSFTAKDICTVDIRKRPDPFYITNPIHGGKVTCHKCGGFILEGDGEGYLDHQHRDEFPNVWFHKKCFNRYEHYYGLDRPID